MGKIVKVKNTLGVDTTWVGQTILAGEYFTIPENVVLSWKNDSAVFLSVGNGELLVNNGIVDFTKPTDGWNWLSGETFPVSDVGTKMAVHESPKPVVPGKPMYAYWAGAGDDVVNHIVGAGQKGILKTIVGQVSTSIDLKFDPTFGKVFLHDGFIIWKDAGIGTDLGDCVDVEIVASPTSLQTAANLNYVIESNKVKAVAPGTGTHGFAANPVLVPNITTTGWWNYDVTAGLTFSNTQTGKYDIWNIEQVANRFVNKFLVFGTNNTYTDLSSEDTSEIPAGYFIRMTAHNVSDTVWYACIVMEMFRERTV